MYVPDMRIRFKKIHKDAICPCRAYRWDAGADIFSIENAKISPNENKMIKTGIICDVPEGWALYVMGKSGRLLNNNLVCNIGIIDSGYRGQILANLYNIGNEDVIINCGEKIAQIVLMPVWCGKFEEVCELEDTERGGNGFGSTGIKRENRLLPPRPSYDSKASNKEVLQYLNEVTDTKRII